MEWLTLQGILFCWAPLKYIFTSQSSSHLGSQCHDITALCLSGGQQSKQKFFLWDLFLSPLILLYLKEATSLNENEPPLLHSAVITFLFEVSYSSEKQGTPGQDCCKHCTQLMVPRYLSQGCSLQHRNRRETGQKGDELFWMNWRHPLVWRYSMQPLFSHLLKMPSQDIPEE